MLPGPSPKPNGGGREGLGRLGTAQAAGCRGWGPGGVVGGEGFVSGMGPGKAMTGVGGAVTCLSGVPERGG